MPYTFADLGAEQFVSLTTYRRTGEPVATAVWVASDGPDLVVTTGAQTGKVKRVRRTSDVTLAACSRSGVVAPDAPRLEGTAEVVDDAGLVRTGSRPILAKYGIQFRLLTLAYRIPGRPRRRVLLRIRPRTAHGRVDA